MRPTSKAGSSGTSNTGPNLRCRACLDGTDLPQGFRQGGSSCTTRRGPPRSRTGSCTAPTRGIRRRMQHQTGISKAIHPTGSRAKDFQNARQREVPLRAGRLNPAGIGPERLFSPGRRSVIRFGAMGGVCRPRPRGPERQTTEEAGVRLGVRRDSRRTPSPRQFRRKLLERDRLHAVDQPAHRAGEDHDPARAAGEPRRTAQHPPLHPSARPDLDPPGLAPDLEHQLRFGTASGTAVKERSLGPERCRSPVQPAGDQVLKQDAPFVGERRVQRTTLPGVPYSGVQEAEPRRPHGGNASS